MDVHECVLSDSKSAKLDCLEALLFLELISFSLVLLIQLLKYMLTFGYCTARRLDVLSLHDIVHSA